MVISNHDKEFNIICLSNQLWGYPLLTNKKHVMSRLADLGHKVLFIDPPINTGRLFFRQLVRGNWSLKRLILSQYDEEKVRIYSPLDVTPFNLISSRLHIRRIKKIQKRFFEDSRKTFLWVYHVEIGGLEYYLKNLNYDLLIYDCVDNYVGFPKYDTDEKKEKIIKQEEMLAGKADLVFATAPGLVEKLQKYTSAVYYTPNVGDYKKFKDAKSLKDEIPADLEKIPRPRIAFTGSVDKYKFDVDLVLKAAEDHPNYSFVIIGPMALKDCEADAKKLGVKGIKNIYFLGSRPYKDIHKYFAGFDVYIIPYQLNDYTVGGCFPVKFHDGLAAGLPVIVTDLPAYSPFKDVCYISKNYDEFSRNIKIALEEDNPQKAKERQKVAKQNDWDSKVSNMLEIITQALLKKG